MDRDGLLRTLSEEARIQRAQALVAALPADGKPVLVRPTLTRVARFKGPYAEIRTLHLAEWALETRSFPLVATEVNGRMCLSLISTVDEAHLIATTMEAHAEQVLAHAAKLRIGAKLREDALRAETDWPRDFPTQTSLFG